MRHRNGLRKLNRTSSHRQAMLRNMANSLLRHEVIKTTVPKAKELRKVVEPLITLGKKPSLANRRLAFDRLRDREIVVKIFDELGPRFAARNGGYLRILKCGFRDGDNAPMAFVELLDRPEGEVEAPRPSRLRRKARVSTTTVKRVSESWPFLLSDDVSQYTCLGGGRWGVVYMPCSRYRYSCTLSCFGRMQSSRPSIP